MLTPFRKKTETQETYNQHIIEHGANLKVIAIKPRKRYTISFTSIKCVQNTVALTGEQLYDRIKTSVSYDRVGFGSCEIVQFVYPFDSCQKRRAF